MTLATVVAVPLACLFMLKLDLVDCRRGKARQSGRAAAGGAHLTANDNGRPACDFTFEKAARFQNTEPVWHAGGRHWDMAGLHSAAELYLVGLAEPESACPPQIRDQAREKLQGLLMKVWIAIVESLCAVLLNLVHRHVLKDTYDHSCD
jgi:hypothetical protein